MAHRISTGAAHVILNALVNGGSGVNFDSGIMEIRTGSQPGSADDAPTGTLLASVPLSADAFAAAAARAALKQGDWEDSSADGGSASTPGWYRMRQSGDAGGSSTTAIRVDGAITPTGGGGEMIMDGTITAGQPVVITSYQLSA